MKRILFVFSLLLVMGLLIAGCTKETVVPESQPGDNAGTESQTANPEEYIDTQIVDENSSIDIGEMI